MNRANRPQGASQDYINRSNDYSDTSYTSSEVRNAPIPVASQQPALMSTQQQQQQQQQQLSPREYQTNVRASPGVGCASGLGSIGNATELNRGGSRPKPRTRAQVLVANLFHIGVSDVQRIAGYIFFLISFLNLLFLILSCSLAQFDALNNACMTFWGYKSNCDTKSYTIVVDLLQCSRDRKALKLCAGFSIMAILFSSALWFMSWIICCWFHSHRLKCLFSYNKEERIQNVPLVDLGKMRWYMIGAMAIIIVFEFVAWVVIAAMHGSVVCVELLSAEQAYGVGFRLGVCAWVLEVLLLACLLLLI